MVYRFSKEEIEAVRNYSITEGENMTDITIKYDHGQMLIHLDNFLSDRKISEVRKLIKLIRQSYTPECEEQIKEYIQCGVKELDNIIMITEKRIDRNEAEVKDAEKDLKTWLYFRSLHKKGRTPGM